VWKKPLTYFVPLWYLSLEEQPREAFNLGGRAQHGAGVIMVQINFAAREVNCKIVYYGPGRSGKTTNLEVVHAKAPGDSKG